MLAGQGRMLVGLVKVPKRVVLSGGGQDTCAK